jgi:hypothetical protein
MIHLLNADRGSYGSVKPLVDAGRVRHIPVATYTDFEKAVNELRDAVEWEDGVNAAGEKIKVVKPHDDLVILDSVSRMADSTRGDFKLGPDESVFWNKRDIYYKGDTYNFGAYEAASQFIMRHLRNLNVRGYRIIAVCHEDEQKEDGEGIKKRAPALNPALWQSLRASSTDIFRLTAVTEDQFDGEGNLFAKTGTRLLQTTNDDFAICKYTALPDLEGNFKDIPKFLPNPTMRKISRMLGAPPDFLTLYGNPGAGKTTLACSDAFDPKPKKAKQTNE